MANPIDLIITKQALEVVDSAIAKVNLLDKTMQEATQHFIDNSKKMALATPSGVAGNAENNAAITAQLKTQADTIAKLSAELVNLNDKLTKLNTTKSATKKLTADEIVQNQAERKAAIELAKANSSLIGSYEKLNIRHQQAVRNAQNLGATYGVTSKQFKKAADEANVLDKELKELDSTLGKNQRNVGNYKSGYNALGNSINQLSREAPAFANSMNTGFMAISNNLPALTDAIKGIREENALLKAEGKPTVSVFKQLASSIFSWQTLISVGVTLLTVYGAKLVEITQAAIKGNGAFKSMAENQEALNLAVQEGNKDASKEISQLDILYRTATNVALSTEQRKKAVDKLQELYPSYFKNIDDEVIKNGKAEQSYYAVRDAVFASARAKAIQGELEKRAGERLEEELKIREQISEAEKEINSLKKSGIDLVIEASAQDRTPRQVISNAELIAAQQRLLKVRTDSLKKFQKDSLASDDLLLKAQEEYQNKSAILEADRIKVKVEKDKVAKREDIDGLESHLVKVGTLVDEINAEISRLTTEKIVANADELPAVNFQLEQLLKLRSQLNQLPTVDFKIQVPAQEAKEALKELSEEQKKYLDSFTKDFVSQSGFTETFRILNDEVEGFGEDFKTTFVAVAESAQEFFNFFSQNSQANFENEKDRLSAQKEISLQYAGENAEAKAKIEEDYQKRQKEIATREAKAKKQQAIFNIAIDTAQAIMATLGKTGFAGIPLSIIVGAIGAAQIAMIAAQEIPQYAEGGIHDGGLMIVNDGKGSNYKETIVTPNGKVMKPQGRNVIMDAPAGTEIFTHNMWQDQLTDMLQGKGISMSSSNQYSGITKSDLEDVMMRSIANQTQYHGEWNAKGYNEYVRKGNNITRGNIMRGNAKGLKF